MIEEHAPPVHPMSQRGEQVRRRLMGAAAELIPEVGWSAVSTRMVADRAGVAPGLVHYHFASLRALMAEAALGVVGDVGARTVAGLALARDLESGLTDMFAALEPYSGTDSTSLLFSETYLAATRDEGLRREMGALVTRFVSELAEWLAARGVGSPQATAQVLVATIDGLMLHRALTPPDGSVVGVVRRLVAAAGEDVTS
jgi:AcrR family transcriptional regulator